MKLSYLAGQCSMERPIGIMDSGFGGLTVLKEIHKKMPSEDILYFGDTKNVPYGEKSPEEIKRLSLKAVEFLKDKDIKALVIACNTATAIAFEDIDRKLDVDVIGTIVPCVSYLEKRKDLHTLGLIGTRATVKSKTYRNLLGDLRPDLRVFSKATPDFVDLVESCEIETEEAKALVGKDLEYFKKLGIDGLILACTHFPILEKQIQRHLGQGIELIDPAKAVANELEGLLRQKSILNQGPRESHQQFYVSGDVAKFDKFASYILDRDCLVSKQV